MIALLPMSAIVFLKCLAKCMGTFDTVVVVPVYQSFFIVSLISMPQCVHRSAGGWTCVDAYTAPGAVCGLGLVCGWRSWVSAWVCMGVLAAG